ncbi:MAG: hypothetical protein AAGJ35_02645, partial [Myxococcota bacterium]
MNHRQRTNYIAFWLTLYVLLSTTAPAHALDSLCQAGCQQDADCSGTTAKCNPSTNQCVACLEDQDCARGQECVLKEGLHQCADAASTQRCSDIKCTSDQDCLLAKCGRFTNCVRPSPDQPGICSTPPDSAQCHPPNLVVVLDRSLSMEGNYRDGKRDRWNEIDSGFTCPSDDDKGNDYCATQNPNMKHLAHTEKQDVCASYKDNPNSCKTWGDCISYKQESYCVSSTCSKYEDKQHCVSSQCSKEESYQECVSLDESGNCLNYETRKKCVSWSCTQYETRSECVSWSCTQTGTRTVCDQRSCAEYNKDCVSTGNHHVFPRCKKNSQGHLTCHYTRWDVATNALIRALSEYGGKAELNYEDRKVRFGLVFFDDKAFSSTTLQGISAPALKGTSYSPAYHGVIDSKGNIVDSSIHKEALLAQRPLGQTGYTISLNEAEQVIVQARKTDALLTRKTVLLFVTDGAPTWGNTSCSGTPTNCTSSSCQAQLCGCAKNKVDQLYSQYGIKTYVVGFGNGLSSSAQSCLNNIAQAGKTRPQSCPSGRADCLFYKADRASSMREAFNEIIASATAEECDGLDNNCDGRIDEGNPGGSCSCLKSYTQNISTAFVDRKRAKGTTPAKDIQMYTFVSQYDETGSCLPPTDPSELRIDQTYRQICRNLASRALQCVTGASVGNPPGDSWPVYCQRCCNYGTNACSWPSSHGCHPSQRPWSNGATQTPEQCYTSCKNWCTSTKMQAAACSMPRGEIQRISLTAGTKQLQVSETLNLGKVLNTQADTDQRALFVNTDDPNNPDQDNRMKAPSIVPTKITATGPEFEIDNRPQLVDLQEGGNLSLEPTSPKTAQATVPTANQFISSNNNQGLTTGLRLSCSADQCKETCKGPFCCTPNECAGGCTGTDCDLQKNSLLALLRGKGGTSSLQCLVDGKTTSTERTRCHTLGAIYRSTPALLTPPLAANDDPTYLTWRNTPLSGGPSTIATRPNILFVGSNDG